MGHFLWLCQITGGHYHARPRPFDGKYFTTKHVTEVPMQCVLQDRAFKPHALALADGFVETMAFTAKMVSFRMLILGSLIVGFTHLHFKGTFERLILGHKPYLVVHPS